MELVKTLIFILLLSVVSAAHHHGHHHHRGHDSHHHHHQKSHEHSHDHGYSHHNHDGHHHHKGQGRHGHDHHHDHDAGHHQRSHKGHGHDHHHDHDAGHHHNRHGHGHDHHHDHDTRHHHKGHGHGHDHHHDHDTRHHHKGHGHDHHHDHDPRHHHKGHGHDHHHDHDARHHHKGHGHGQDHHHDHGAQDHKSAPKTSGQVMNISAVYAFGDASVDTGNNNRDIHTGYRSNHAPYGCDFPHHAATGRSSNGKLIVDLIASHLKLKDTLTAFNDPSRTDEDLQTGISYGISGTGLDNSTAHNNGVSTMNQQVDVFELTVRRLVDKVGEESARKIVGSAVYVISVGTNDMVDNYYNPSSTVSLEMDVPTYHVNLLAMLELIIKRLYDYGARKFMVFGMPPVGCLPIEVSLSSGSNCVPELNGDAEGYNINLQVLLTRISLHVPDVSMEYVDIYSPMREMIYNGHEYGFENTIVGCCGATEGSPVGGVNCNEYVSLCGDRDRFVFWDSMNPTQAVNVQLARLIEKDVLSKFY